jgi:serine/threonine protein kinase
MAVSGAGKHLAFQPLELPELDLDDPEQRDFGYYELLERLGRGGMGVVYRAMQRSLLREVAIKLLSAGPWASPEFVARFRREAQNAARLQHPNIVSIHEVGQYAELDFFSMALVRGRNLEQHVEAFGALSPHDAARLVRTLAEAIY